MGKKKSNVAQHSGLAPLKPQVIHKLDTGGNFASNQDCNFPPLKRAPQHGMDGNVGVGDDSLKTSRVEHKEEKKS